MTNTTNTNNWSAVAMSGSVYIVRRREDGEIVDIACAGDVTDLADLAAELLLAHATDGDLIGEGAEDLLACLPTDEAETLRRDCADILDAWEPLANCDVLVEDGDARMHQLAGLLGDELEVAESWFDVVHVLLSDEAVVRALLDLYPGWTLDTTVAKHEPARGCDPLFSDFFAAADAADAAHCIDGLDAVYEMLDYDGRASSLGAEGVREVIELVEPDDEDECADGRRLLLAEEVWTWSDEHVFVEAVYDRLLKYAGADFVGGARGARVADEDALPAWTWSIDWDFDALDRIDAQVGVRDALWSGYADERAEAALRWADDMLGRYDGRYPRSL